MKLTLIFAGVAGASKFLEELTSEGQARCTEGVIGGLDTSFPKLKECYNDSSLYFSDLKVPCSDSCMDVTIRAAARVSKMCDTGAPDADHPVAMKSEKVYSVWTDEEAVRALCTSYGDNICLEEFFAISMQLLLPPTPYGYPGLRNSDICTKCTREIYNRFHQIPYQLPVVYYNVMNDPPTIFKNLGLVCGWS
ncbi:hypothetical protein DSO57_1009853 [Entomophthora muscae]|uniref:Uncharacterized protein n=1 Tax=Entomophthora muscae TaxID=34485 RepID=A0ACC2SJE6_9FUNG|nr:hypothetical protein DSO57_1009853 [Entomophthora muscae]